MDTVQSEVAEYKVGEVKVTETPTEFFFTIPSRFIRDTEGCGCPCHEQHTPDGCTTPANSVHSTPAANAEGQDNNDDCCEDCDHCDDCEQDCGEVEPWQLCALSMAIAEMYLSPVGLFNAQETDLTFNEFVGATNSLNVKRRKHYHATCRSRADPDQWTVSDVADVMWSSSESSDESYITQRLAEYQDWAGRKTMDHLKSMVERELVFKN